MLYKPILLAKDTNKKSDISISEEYLILASNGPKYPRICKVILKPSKVVAVKVSSVIGPYVELLVEVRGITFICVLTTTQHVAIDNNPAVLP